jgi:hypothetical protein
MAVFSGAKLMQISQWGFPKGSLRPAPNPALAYSVIHITGNGVSTAEGEALYRINNPNVGVGATFFVNSDGSVVQCYEDPLRMDPWTNGILNRPDLASKRIAAVAASGVNPNERSLITIELCGLEPARPITAAQEATASKLIAWAHDLIDMPVNRETVVGHYQFDSVNRPNCPSRDKSVIDRIVAGAAGETDVNLKGSNPRPINNRTTHLKFGGYLVADCTAMPYANLLAMPAGMNFTPSWQVTGNLILGTKEWYGGWVFTTPPQFGYVSLGLVGDNPLMPIENIGDEAAAEKKGAEGAAAAAVGYAASLF